MLFQMHIRMPMIVTITIAVMVTDVIDFTKLPCSSLNGGNQSSVNEIYCSGVVCCGVGLPYLSCKFKNLF